MHIDRRRYRSGAPMETALDPLTQRRLREAADDLQREFRGIFSTETIGHFLIDSPPVRAQIRIEDFVRERLRALAQAEGRMAKDVPELLFVCVHNAGRSQMAAGLVKLHSQGRVHVRSAGTDPSEQVNPAVIEAMDEVGVDMSQEFPKPRTDEIARAADVVITMGCGDACPLYPGKKYETGPSTIRRARASRRCAGSGTRSTAGCAG
jgi:arsenate reductase (thioredoxin)